MDKCFKYVTALPLNEKCVGITEYDGRVLVATDAGVYELKGDVLEPIRFVMADGPSKEGNYNIYGVDLDKAAKAAHELATALVKDHFADTTSPGAKMRYATEKAYQYRIMTRP